MNCMMHYGSILLVFSYCTRCKLRASQKSEDDIFFSRVAFSFTYFQLTPSKPYFSQGMRTQLKSLFQGQISGKNSEQF